jgi:NAD(P)H-dependent FMN reductase
MKNDKLRVLLVPGSSRTGSFNLKLAQVAARLLTAQGAEADLIDLRSLGLPLYDGDLELESGVPAGAGRLVAEIAAHDALLVVSPEYNAFPPPLLINAIDWATRLPEHKAALNGKPTALLSASPGALGGVRSLMFLRQFLALNPALLVLPEQAAVNQAGQAFDPEGSLREARDQRAVAGVVTALLRVAGALKAG